MRFFSLLFLIAFSTKVFGIHASFTTSADSGCPPLMVNFTDNSTGNIIEWYWDFGNGNTSDKPDPSAEFLTSGTYHVKLTVTDNTGAKDSTEKNIRVFKVPTIDFTVDKTVACVGTPINFQNLVTPGDAPVNQYGWGFGNGTAHNDSNTVYAYPQPGTYNVTLVVQDTNGCSANKTLLNYITILPAPQASFTASPAVSCDSTQLVTFTNQSTGVGLNYLWKLSDTTTSTLQNPVYTYHQQGQTVTLTVTDSSGCISQASEFISAKNVIPNFAISVGSICTGAKQIFTNESTQLPGNGYAWYFGDGTISNSTSPDKAYTSSGVYNVTLVVKNGPCIDSISRLDSVVVTTDSIISTPSFTADSTISCTAPLTVHFTNTTTGGNVYNWVFSNGDSSNLQNPTISFDSLGSYSVHLTVTDTTTGCSVSGPTVHIINIGLPVANFTFSDTVSCAGSAITFVNKSTGANTYLWTYGNGDTTYATSPEIQFSGNQNFTVTLTAISSAGCDSTVSASGTTVVEPINVNFDVSSTFSPCPPFACVLHNESSSNIVKFLWKFGDGYTDANANPTHIYFYPGIYTVTLIGWTAAGCVDTMVYPNLITVQGPSGSFILSPTTGCVPLTVNFTDTVTPNTKTFWCDLGDGNIITDSFSFSNIYTQAHTYYPQFVLVDHVGCTVPFSVDSIIAHTITPFQVNDTSVCSGTTLNVSLSQNGNRYSWLPSTFLSCDSCNKVAINDTGNTTYQITGTNQFGCPTSDSLQVTVVPLPQLNDSVTYSLCNKDTLTLFIGNATKMVWSPGLYLSDSTSLTPTCWAPSSITYTAKAFNSLGCMVSTQVPVTVGSKVGASLINDTTICENGSIELQSRLSFASSVGIQYAWTPSSYLNNADSASPIATLSNSQVNFQLIVSSGHCVPDTQHVTVSVAPMPDIQACPPVITTPYAQVQLFAESHQELTYQWFGNDSTSCIDENCDRTYIYPSQSQTVTVTGTSKYGCVVKAEVPIDVMGCDAGTIFLPNTFTPNGDGVDDKFIIRSKTLASLSYFRVFDQWGKMVFETNQIDEGWDGTIAGKPAPVAVYVYVLEGQCQNGAEVMKQGNVTAIR